MKRIQLLLQSAAMFFLSSALAAQIPSIKVQGVNDPETVYLKKINIDVEIIGNTATTTMTMVFRNRNANRILEGELTFPLPEGVTVSRYALDINGKMREAVPVSKTKATEVFENIEHRQVDPGLLERIEGNNFRTRIYPLPANGERTVLIAYEEVLPFNNGNAMRYQLPLNFVKRIPEFSLHTKVYRTTQKPQFIQRPDDSFAFSENNQVYEASLSKTDYVPARSLVIDLPKDTSVPEAILQENRDGSYYFLVNAYPSAKLEKKKWGNRIGIIWDNSLSGLQRDREKELALLDKIIREKQNLTIELGLLNVSFRKTGSFTIKNGNWDELKTCLQQIVYDGGTDFGQLNDRILAADEYLFFTDGMSTFGENTAAFSKPIYAVSSSIRANYSGLKAICAKTGGKFVNLMNTNVEVAFQTFSDNQLQFLGIQEKTGISEVYPSIPTAVNGHIAVAGITRNGSGELTLLFGRNGKVEHSQKVRLNKQANDVDVSKFWAQKKIAEMDIQYEQHKEEIERLGRQFGIVTRNTSLLVLEDLADYVRYEIVPPAELLPAYNELIKNRLVEQEQRVKNLLDRAVLMMDDLKAWWHTDFKPEKMFPTPQKNRNTAFTQAPLVMQHEPPFEEALLLSVDEGVSVDEMEIVSSEAHPSQAQTHRYVSSNRMQMAEVVEAESEAPFDAYHAQKENLRIVQQPRQTAKIKTPVIRSDKEYMQQIRSATDAYTTYLSLRETYMETPGFYFDVSDFFYETKQREKGLLVLSSLADLGVENAELFKTLAYRLKEKGEYTHELFVTGKVLEWRPMDPQSHRDHALALQDNGRYQEALDGLYSVLTASYSPEAASRDYGIEEILVCEINHLVSLHRKKLDLSGIDARIIADLPVHIRVVINWNKNDTDIDLWVTDPNGETCMYSHNRTASGGRLSRDFTQGYGPEQFLLKKAINGTYRIETNFFGERQLTLSGPTTIMGEIFLYYGDGREERQVITFQNGANGKESEGVLIGEFIFSDQKETALGGQGINDFVKTMNHMNDLTEGQAGSHSDGSTTGTEGANESNLSACSGNLFLQAAGNQKLWILGFVSFIGIVIALMKRRG